MKGERDVCIVPSRMNTHTASTHLRTAILFTLALTAWTPVFADQYAVLTEQQTKLAVRILENSETVLLYCAPCGGQAQKVEVRSVNSVPWDMMLDHEPAFEVELNQRGIDMAYAYVPGKDGWENVAHLMGLSPSSVPFEIPNADPVDGNPLDQDPGAHGSKTMASGSSNGSEMTAKTREDRTRALGPCNRKAQTFVVPGDARRRFQTGLEIAKGETLFFEARGQIRPGSHEWVGPDGSSNEDWNRNDNLFNVIRHAGLMAHIGKGGEVFAVGSRAQIQAGASGLLFLLINDDSPGNNRGQFVVEVTVCP